MHVPGFDMRQPIYPNANTVCHALLIGLFAIWSNVSFANDSLGRVGAGGIELLTTSFIQMKQEILEISPKQINVSYQFFNTSNKDTKSLVAFPMPSYGFAPGFDAWEQNMHPIDDFKVSVEGVNVETQEHYKMLHGGVDVTNTLQSAGLTTSQMINFGGCFYSDEKSTFICDLNDEQKAILGKQGIIELDENNVGVPRWEIEKTLTWEQTFPAKTLLSVKHTYVPLKGGNFSYPVYQGKKNEGSFYHAAAVAEDNAEACLDDSFKRAYNARLEKLVAAGAKTIMVDLDDVEYILGTAKNWAGPIQDFVLQIKKADKDQLVSLCFPGSAVKVDPLTIEFKHKNFVPQDKLVVYFYSFRVE